MRYLSLFSGIGGFECGIHTLWGNKAQCLGFSEVDKRACQVYQKHFPTHPALGDVHQVDFTPFRGQVDLLVGGSPCQDLSRLRNCNPKDVKDIKDIKQGVLGEKSILLLEFFRCLQECQPRFFILENVASMSKENQDIISQLLQVSPVLINAKYFSAQKRPRLFWCNFPIQPDPESFALANSIARKRFSDLLVSQEEAASLAHSETRVKYFLSSKTTGKEGLPRLEKYQGFNYSTLEDKVPSLLASQHALVLDYRFGPFSHPDYDGPLPLLRKLSQVEAERLQGFPDGWTRDLFYSTAIRCLGNAVSVPVIVFIIHQLSFSL